MSAIPASSILDVLLPPFPENEGTRAFALLDAARDDRIYSAVVRARSGWTCLYRGDAAVTMAEVAPYLVELDRASDLTWWILEQGWGESWGVFVNASAPMAVLRAHFRRFLYARLPDGRTVYFRFYDPRVLRVYLPTCTPEEVDAVLGPVERFVTEDEHGEMVVFSRLETALAAPGGMLVGDQA